MTSMKNTANLDWSSLGFDYTKTDCNVRYTYSDGKWSEMIVTDDEYVPMHMSASCLHYGIELFEGLKAFRGVDGKVRLFRVDENAKRLISSAERLCLPLPTQEMIVNACIEVVKPATDIDGAGIAPGTLELAPFACVLLRFAK